MNQVQNGDFDLTTSRIISIRLEFRTASGKQATLTQLTDFIGVPKG
jgi:hypothetical protein